MLNAAIKETENILEYIQGFKYISLKQQALERKLYNKLNRLMGKAAAEVMAELQSMTSFSSPTAIQNIIHGLKQEERRMIEAIMDSADEAAGHGRDMVAQELRDQGYPIDLDRMPSQIRKRIRDHVFDASKRTMARITGDVMNNLTDSYDKGLGIWDAADRLTAEFSNIRNWELRRIARTEIQGAQNAGAYETEQELRIQYHQWWSAQDERVRDDKADHVHMQGQIVKVGERFSNGLRYPGDRSGPIEEWINCRCREVPFLMPEGHKPPTSQNYFYEDDLISEVKDVHEKVREKEKEIWDKTLEDKNEHGSLIDKDGNEVVSHRQGDSTSCRWSGEELRKGEGGILTHTHPPGSFPGLSETDIAVAHKRNLGEIRAVMGDTVYALKRPKDGWPAWSADKITDTAQEIKRSKINFLEKLIKKGHLTREGLEQTVFIQINKEYAKKVGAEFITEAR